MLAVALGALAAACSGAQDAASPGEGAGASSGAPDSGAPEGGADGADGGAADVAGEGAPDAASPDGSLPDTQSADSVGDASSDAPGSDAAPEAATDAQDAGGAVYKPTPADVQFAALHPFPKGEQLLFNDWDPMPNAVWSLSPDGKTATRVFDVYRLWSMGVSRAVDRIAFSCGDPQQEAHYGLKLGDAIQHTWLYDIATETISLAAWGNINDECHSFGPGDKDLFVCRRYDFTDQGDSKGYRVGRIALPSLAFEWLTDEVAKEYTLYPQPTPDGLQMYYGRMQLQAPKVLNAIMRRPLPAGSPVVARDEANRAVLSPDGLRYAYQNFQDGRTLWVSNLDGSGALKVSVHEASEAAFSPDGKQIAYLWHEQAKNCSHIEVVAADGSTAATPKRLRDCGATGELITQLAWVLRP